MAENKDSSTTSSGSFSYKKNLSNDLDAETNSDSRDLHIRYSFYFVNNAYKLNLNT
jgi:hypothetical protein